MDFKGFLNDLQDWELSRKHEEAPHTNKNPQKENDSASQNTGLGSSRRDTLSFDNARSNSRQYNDPFSRVTSSFVSEDIPDAVSEKDLGNEYFKQKKYKEAIDCYSRSIAFSPTAVAYANRAMAYIKLRRFQEAEDDCTEALNLDDRYIKAYSRRATSRKELAKFKESMEDAEFALRLEPNNQEIKKQHADAKSLYDKAMLDKVSGALKSTVKGTQKEVKLDTKKNGGSIHPISHITQKSGPAKGNEQQIPAKESYIMEEVDSNKIRSRAQRQEADGSSSSNNVQHVKRNQKGSKQHVQTSIQQLASRAASLATAEAAKNITPPTTAYQFEVSWRGFSGDRSLQTCLLKAISPHELPKIFKNALSTALLIDIIKCVASFFNEQMDLAVSYMEHLTKVPRFDMIVMCLPSTDKDDLRKIWDEVFCGEATPMEFAEILDNLRSKYCLGQ
ncbi:uncharacterized protein LOC107465191 isoform X1 [Arachis duranensis]|uniref:Uncharacterized protein LOC107465191 isoform X1 n=1 Tax=Arachis duranensis TaxID=130453 RepID=A0A6P4BBT3_ARADU|nr:uncharacterized protein LOC107465191 isoform X1 [Arachis duranensis]XP_025618886.1 RNA polymerase II-associated protein 3 isoform X1 [Arachis hypogaea]